MTIHTERAPGVYSSGDPLRSPCSLQPAKLAVVLPAVLVAIPCGRHARCNNPMHTLSHLGSALWQQLLSLHMGIERVLVPAIDSFGILNGLVAICVSNTAREKHRAGNGDFQELRLFAACQARL